MTARSVSRLRKAIAGLAVLLTFTGGAMALDIAPASAACVTSYVDTNGNNPNRSFQISSASTCNDLNFRQATVGQNYRGEYLSGGYWYVGSAGWVWRSPSTTNLAVVIYNIANGTTVRATGALYNAYIYAVH